MGSALASSSRKLCVSCAVPCGPVSNRPDDGDRSFRQGAVVESRENVPAIGIKDPCGTVTGKNEDRVAACGGRARYRFRANAAEPRSAYWCDSER
jgi:hypothetical protein